MYVIWYLTKSFWTPWPASDSLVKLSTTYQKRHGSNSEDKTESPPSLPRRKVMTPHESTTTQPIRQPKQSPFQDVTRYMYPEWWLTWCRLPLLIALRSTMGRTTCVRSTRFSSILSTLKSVTNCQAVRTLGSMRTSWRTSTFLTGTKRKGYTA